MSIDAGFRASLAATLSACLAAATLLAAPVDAAGADIAWKSTVQSGTMSGGKFVRIGTAVLSTGESAEVRTEGSDGAADDNGRPTVKVESVMKFKDGSTITSRYSGWRDPKTLEVGGAGEFVSGTGKYQGITGTYTYKGSVGGTEAVGTYTLKK